MFLVMFDKLADTKPLFVKPRITSSVSSMGCPPGLTGPGSSVHPSGGDAGHGVGGRVLGEGGQEEDSATSTLMMADRRVSLARSSALVESFHSAAILFFLPTMLPT